MKSNWVKEFPSAITVCDNNGIILQMNDKSAELFNKNGGYDLIGKQLMNCHPAKSQEKIKEMLQNQSENYYITDNDGQKKLIIQIPWYEGKVFKGLVEIVNEIKTDIPVYKR